MSDESGPRIYGTPDPDDQPPPAGEGLHGEARAAQPARHDLAHGVTTSSGNHILLEEQSGTAFAEATGKAEGEDPEVSDQD